MKSVQDQQAYLCQVDWKSQTVAEKMGHPDS